MLIDHTIYDKIWQADSNRLSVSLRNKQGKWFNPDADILLDLQCKSSNRRWIDLAPHPLFHKVNDINLSKPTYAALIAMFDNYIADQKVPEEYSKQEIKEIKHFLNLILETEPLQIAYNYICQNPQYAMTLSEFKEQLRIIWFEPFTNYTPSEGISYSCGFEHIFVGELKLEPDKKIGEILGYHNWVKFFFDERKGKVNFLGTRYRIPLVPRLLSPNVVVLQMTGKFGVKEGLPVPELYKEKASFFVGSSPECEIALATVAFFESLHSRKFKSRRSIHINKERYDLIVNREVTKDNQANQHIRSFYPEFHGKVFYHAPSSSFQSLKQDGPVVILSALAHPKENVTDEWVVLKNISSSSISLEGWYLCDHLNRLFLLSGSLEPAEERQFYIRTNHFHSMQLGNSGGLIALYQFNAELISIVSYKKAKCEKILIFWEDG